MTFLENIADKIMPKILLFFKPFVLWFDKLFTIPFSVKLINADHYFMWKPKIVKGMIFITDTFGQGSNLINPSKGKHGAIYFGTGLKTYLQNLVAGSKNIEWDFGPAFASYYNAHIEDIHDDVEYVIEALGHGVQATSVIRFLTTKDVVSGHLPKFCDASGRDKAANYAVLDLGLPYDFEFNDRDNAKYCFEVLADAYLKENKHVGFETEEYFGYRVYTSSAFKDERVWAKMIDSQKEFPELYQKR